MTESGEHEIPPEGAETGPSLGEDGEPELPAAPAPVPELTREDVHAFVQVLTALCMMGSTRIEIHPERWPLIFRGLILHRAFDIEQVYYVDGKEDFDHAVMHLEFSTERGKVGCLLTMRGVHAGESDEQRKILDDQGQFYDVPEEPKLIEGADKKIWLPS